MLGKYFYNFKIFVAKQIKLNTCLSLLTLTIMNIMKQNMIFYDQNVLHTGKVSKFFMCWKWLIRVYKKMERHKINFNTKK